MNITLDTSLSEVVIKNVDKYSSKPYNYDVEKDYKKVLSDFEKGQLHDDSKKRIYVLANQ